METDGFVSELLLSALEGAGGDATGETWQTVNNKISRRLKSEAGGDGRR